MQPGLGKAFSILALVLSPFNTHYRRMYSGVLDYAQIAYIFSIGIALHNPTFSRELGYSWLSFFPHILDTNSHGALVSSFDYLITFLLLWTIIVIAVLILVRILQNCCKKKISYQSFYTIFKALYRWAFPPLLYDLIDLMFSHFKGAPDN